MCILPMHLTALVQSRHSLLERAVDAVNSEDEATQVYNEKMLYILAGCASVNEREHPV